MLSEIAVEFGQLSIGSSGALLNIANKKTSVSSNRGRSKGTVLGLRMSVPEDLYFANFLERTKVRGEAMAKNIKGARSVASRASGGLW